MSKTTKKPIKIERKFVGVHFPLDIYDALSYEASAAERSLSAHILFIAKQSLAKTHVVRK